MRILRSDSYRRMPWKNGGGETTEIAVFPEGAGLDGFDWRISMARVDAGGPFSVFPDIDRTLSILEGEGMRLDIDGMEPVTLTVASPPHSFPADAATTAALVGGPITDLNVMTRRGLYRHRVDPWAFDGSCEGLARASTTLIFCRSGDISLSSGGRRETLGRLDVAVLEAGTAFTIEGRGQIFLIAFDPV